MNTLLLYECLIASMDLTSAFPNLNVTLKQVSRYCAPPDGYTVQFLHDAGLDDNGNVRSVLDHIQYRTQNNGSVNVYLNSSSTNDFRELIKAAQANGWEWINTDESPTGEVGIEEISNSVEVIRFKPHKEISVEKTV